MAEQKPPRQSARMDTAFCWPIRVYWEDTDAGGIVFYANYLKYFERSRTEWLRSLGLQQQRLKEDTQGMFVVSDTSVRYLRPARLDDELIVTTRIVEIGRASLIISQQALLKTEQHPASRIPGQATTQPLLCEGTIRIGWVHAISLQPLRMPPALVSCFSL